MGAASAVVIPCPVGARLLRAPADRGCLSLTCPDCQHKWDWTPMDGGVQSNPTPDYYEVLQVSPKADPEVIQAALRQLAKKHHPDKNPGSPSAERIMKLLNDAAEILCDPERRRAYDDKRLAQQAGEHRRQSVHVHEQWRRQGDIIDGMSRAGASQANEQAWRPKEQPRRGGEPAQRSWYVGRDGDTVGPFKEKWGEWLAVAFRPDSLLVDWRALLPGSSLKGSRRPSRLEWLHGTFLRSLTLSARPNQAVFWRAGGVSDRSV